MRSRTVSWSRYGLKASILASHAGMIHVCFEQSRILEPLYVHVLCWPEDRETLANQRQTGMRSACAAD